LFKIIEGMAILVSSFRRKISILTSPIMSVCGTLTPLPEERLSMQNIEAHPAARQQTLDRDLQSGRWDKNIVFREMSE